MTQGTTNSGGGTSFKANLAGECVQRDKSQDSDYLRARGQSINESTYPDIKGMFPKKSLGTLTYNSLMNDIWTQPGYIYRFNGNLFAHGYDPNEGYYIYKSTNNGINWTKVSGEPDAFVNRGKIELVGNLLIGTDGGDIKTSNDGITWVTKANVYYGVTTQLTFAHNNNNIIVVVKIKGNAGDSDPIYVSSNGGITFKEIEQKVYRGNVGVAYGNGVFITTCWQTGDEIYSSIDGINWIDRGAEPVIDSGQYLDFDETTQKFYWLNPSTLASKVEAYIVVYTSSTGWDYKYNEIISYPDPTNDVAAIYITPLIKYFNRYIIAVQFVNYDDPTFCRLYASQSLTGTYTDISNSIGLGNNYSVLTEDNFYIYGDNEVFMTGSFELLDEPAGWDTAYNLISSSFNVSLPNYSSVCYLRVRGGHELVLLFLYICKVNSIKSNERRWI